MGAAAGAAVAAAGGTLAEQSPPQPTGRIHMCELGVLRDSPSGGLADPSQWI